MILFCFVLCALSFVLEPSFLFSPAPCQFTVYLKYCELDPFIEKMRLVFIFIILFALSFALLNFFQKERGPSPSPQIENPLSENGQTSENVSLYHDADFLVRKSVESPDGKYVTSALFRTFQFQGDEEGVPSSVTEYALTVYHYESGRERELLYFPNIDSSDPCKIVPVPVSWTPFSQKIILVYDYLGECELDPPRLGYTIFQNPFLSHLEALPIHTIFLVENEWAIFLDYAGKNKNIGFCDPRFENLYEKISLMNIETGKIFPLFEVGEGSLIPEGSLWYSEGDRMLHFQSAGITAKEDEPKCIDIEKTSATAKESTLEIVIPQFESLTDLSLETP